MQVYLISRQPTDQKRQISTDGGVQPRWRRDGKELYYLALDGKLMAVDIRVDARIESGVPRPLFDTKLRVDPIRDQFAVTADGQRFLIQVPDRGRKSHSNYRCRELGNCSPQVIARLPAYFLLDKSV